MKKRPKRSMFSSGSSNVRPEPLGPRIRKLADEAWRQGSKELSDGLHELARRAEAEDR